MLTTYIGLGSNLDDPVNHLLLALKQLRHLPQSALIKTSSFYKTQPLGVQDQPDFINAVAALETQLSPQNLLKHYLDLEQQHGRVRRQRWGPRTLDLDILLYGDKIINALDLQIPHPEMTRRAFVLRPLFEIAPSLILPDGQPLGALLLKLI